MNDEVEADEQQLKDIDAAASWLRDRRRIRAELTTKLNEVIASYSCSPEALATRLPVYTEESRRQIVVGLLEAALGWSGDDAEFQTCLTEARKRAVGNVTLLDAIKLKRRLPNA